MRVPSPEAPFAETTYRFKPLHLVVFIAVHTGAALALLPEHITAGAIGVFLAFHFLCGGLGISMGVHRLLSHRSFRTKRWVTYVLAWLASLNWQGGPMWWVATHLRHHRCADRAEDPHSPNAGFFWAHIRWLLYFAEPRDRYQVYSRLVRHLSRDRVFVAIERMKLPSQLAVGVGLFLWGGLPFVLWGVCMRLVVTYHSTWLVNSACHTWGYRSFDSGDRARNLWWVSLLTYGEGWHNNHHTHPTSARLGVRWWEFDPVYLVILLLAYARLAFDVRVVDRNGVTRTLFPSRRLTPTTPPGAAHD